jgi:hypothetical protein
MHTPLFDHGTCGRFLKLRYPKSSGGPLKTHHFCGDAPFFHKTPDVVVDKESSNRTSKIGCIRKPRKFCSWGFGAASPLGTKLWDCDLFLIKSLGTGFFTFHGIQLLTKRHRIF